MKAIHLGDGAYVSVTSDNELAVTANHHEPSMTERRVFIERRSVRELVKFLAEHFLDEVEEGLRERWGKAGDEDE